MIKISLVQQGACGMPSRTIDHETPKEGEDTTMEIFNADTFRHLTCTIDPFVRGWETEDSMKKIDQETIHECVQKAERLVMEGSSLEDFFRETDKTLLLEVQEFWRDKWIQHSFAERGFA
ncbi:hypothetical protein HZC00_02670 [Candidatus Kaiserbacteria bacterium]|nr:hypothetical protein [Candidatus Kaiserbacteria bacterium]